MLLMASDKRVLSITVVLVIALAAVFAFLGGGGNSHKHMQEQLLPLKFFLFDQPRQVAEMPLSNLSGEPKPFGQHVDGWRLVNFGYMSCPDICPINLSLLSDIKNEWDDESFASGLPALNIMHVTFDPVRDTNELLGQYLNYMHPHFYGLTGDLSHIRRLAQELSFVFFHEKPDEEGNYFITHSDSMALINPQGQYVGMFKGPYQKENMIAALKILML